MNTGVTATDVTAAGRPQAENSAVVVAPAAAAAAAVA